MTTRTHAAQPAPLLRRLTPQQAIAEATRREPFDDDALAAAGAIVADVRRAGWQAVLHHAKRLGDLPSNFVDYSSDAPSAAVLGSKLLSQAMAAIAPRDRDVLQHAAERIRTFALAQRQSLQSVESPVVVGGATVGRAGSRWVAVDRAGCYAPGGRFPLPSSVLMTVITARVAGVREVWVASPRPTAHTLAAAAVAGADAVLAIGGPQAIAALAYGAGPVPACDVIVGPGNRFVTAAKHLVSRRVGLDMLAGPSELLVLADDSSDAGLIAADLLAQAEHDPDAAPMLISGDPGLLNRVDAALAAQLIELPTAATARAALRNGFAVLAASGDEMIALSDRLAPEHLEIMTRDPDALAARVTHFGAAFIGAASAEVAGDYGAGPNHVLPTGGAARSACGLWVGTFMQPRTWLSLANQPSLPALHQLMSDTAVFARLEGLEAHARAAERRNPEHSRPS